MKEVTITFHTPPEMDDLAKRFYQHYKVVDFVFTGDDRFSKRNLSDKSTRICLFCGRSMAETSFNTLAHIVPQLIGNSNLYSDFECDECNQHFSKYENDLANYLGFSRSITGIHSDRKASGFAAKQVDIKSRTFVGENILVIAPEDVHRDGPTTTLRYTKNSYIPDHVYNSLLKSALSLLKKHGVIEDYNAALALLAGKFTTISGNIINGFNLPFIVNIPLYIYIFEKLNPEDPCVTHIVSFYFQNRVINIPVLLNKKDVELLKKEHDVYVPPLIFPEVFYKRKLTYQYFNTDLSSPDPKKDDEETIIIEMDKESFENGAIYDPVTKKIAPGTPPNSDSTKYLIVMRDNVTIDPAELSAFLKENFSDDKTQD